MPLKTTIVSLITRRLLRLVPCQEQGGYIVSRHEVHAARGQDPLIPPLLLATWSTVHMSRWDGPEAQLNECSAASHARPKASKSLLSPPFDQYPQPTSWKKTYQELLKFTQKLPRSLTASMESPRLTPHNSRLTITTDPQPDNRFLNIPQRPLSNRSNHHSFKISHIPIKRNVHPSQPPIFFKESI